MHAHGQQAQEARWRRQWRATVGGSASRPLSTGRRTSLVLSVPDARRAASARYRARSGTGATFSGRKGRFHASCSNLRRAIRLAGYARLVGPSRCAFQARTARFRGVGAGRAGLAGHSRRAAWARIPHIRGDGSEGESVGGDCKATYPGPEQWYMRRSKPECQRRRSRASFATVTWERKQVFVREREGKKCAFHRNATKQRAHRRTGGRLSNLLLGRSAARDLRRGVRVVHGAPLELPELLFVRSVDEDHAGDLSSRPLSTGRGTSRVRSVPGEAGKTRADERENDASDQ